MLIFLQKNELSSLIIDKRWEKYTIDEKPTEKRAKLLNFFKKKIKNETEEKVMNKDIQKEETKSNSLETNTIGFLINFS